MTSILSGETKRGTLSGVLPAVTAGVHEIRIQATRLARSDPFTPVQYIDNIRLSGSAVDPGSFIRGDSNGDGQHNITDPIFTLDNLFGGVDALPCSAAADATRNASRSPSL